MKKKKYKKMKREKGKGDNNPHESGTNVTHLYIISYIIFIMYPNIVKSSIKT